MHAILRDLDAGSDPVNVSHRIAALAKVHARLLGAKSEEARAAADAVEAAWAHPIMDRARAAPRRHRELPVHLKLDDGRILEGAIDLAFLEQDRWIVVDFKSDSGSLAHYERQLQWYLHGLSKLTGLESVGYLLRV